MNQLPNQPSNAFNVNEPPNPNVLNIPEQEVSSSSGVANSESGHTPASGKIIKDIKRIYIILLVIGLIVGGVVSLGIVTLLNKVDTTDIPARVDGKTE